MPLFEASTLWFSFPSRLDRFRSTKFLYSQDINKKLVLQKRNNPSKLSLPIYNLFRNSTFLYNTLVIYS
jgi:hypothetical protein